MGGAPGCPQPHFGLAARPLSPSGPVSLPNSHHSAMRSCAGPKGRSEAPPQFFLGVTVLRVVLGRDTASGFTLCPPPIHPARPSSIAEGSGPPLLAPSQQTGEPPQKKKPVTCRPGVAGGCAAPRGCWAPTLGAAGLGGAFFPTPRCHLSARQQLRRGCSIRALCTPFIFFWGGDTGLAAEEETHWLLLGSSPPHAYGAGSQPSGVEAASPCPLGSW